MYVRLGVGGGMTTAAETDIARRETFFYNNGEGTR